MPVWVVFIGNGRYIPRGLAPSWREQLASGVLDVQYLRADRRFSRTRAVLYSLIGIVERSHVYGSLESAKVQIESLSGPEADRPRRRDHRPEQTRRAGDLRAKADRLPVQELSEACRANRQHSSDAERDDRACEVSREWRRLTSRRRASAEPSIRG